MTTSIFVHHYLAAKAASIKVSSLLSAFRRSRLECASSRRSRMCFRMTSWLLWLFHPELAALLERRYDRNRNHPHGADTGWATNNAVYRSCSTTTRPTIQRCDPEGTKRSYGRELRQRQAHGASSPPSTPLRTSDHESPGTNGQTSSSATPTNSLPLISLSPSSASSSANRRGCLIDWWWGRLAPGKTTRSPTRASNARRRYRTLRATLTFESCWLHWRTQTSLTISNLPFAFTAPAGGQLRSIWDLPYEVRLRHRHGAP